MRRYISGSLFLLFCFVLINMSTEIFAGTTGKISGTVKDKSTGEALPGCSISVEGTVLGAVCDVNGEYYIINMRPGKYTLVATMIGYKSYKVTNVQVIVDLTTKVDFSIEATTIDLGETVVRAERPIIEKDVTSKLSIV
ncbi:MAG: carboxypeptidase-like regulatory domain-containing protein, partial [Ignavibacteria bacterium]|nr:carboxypeptidase-like regulatory domain-containing protein [Ignavibacteria bacterium]